MVFYVCILQVKVRRISKYNMLKKIAVIYIKQKFKKFSLLDHRFPLDFSYKCIYRLARTPKPFVTHLLHFPWESCPPMLRDAQLFHLLVRWNLFRLNNHLVLLVIRR